MLTPNASLMYSRLTQEGYTETGAPAANLSVDGQSNTSVNSGLGVKLSKAFTTHSMRVIPEVRASWHHEFSNDAPSQTAQFTAGGSSFTNTGVKEAPDAAMLGVGVTLVSSDTFMVTANYDAILKNAYVGNQGVLEAHWKF